MCLLFMKIFIILIVTQIVSSERYLFHTASISFNRVHQNRVRNRTYLQVTSIDQHHFADAVDMKIRTEKMRLYEGAIKSLPHLKIIRLKHCGIDIMKPTAFRNLPSLEEVHLTDNRLTIIENGVFNYLPIKTLWLQRNKITTIQSSAFDNMPELETIKLNSNFISKWDSRWFANTPKLTELFFKRNHISELPRKAFVNLKTSHKVNGDELVDTRILLNHNNISKIHPEALNGIDSLDELNLRKNTLEEIDWKVFAHMTELHILNLKMNYLTKIDASAFENIEEILDLDLSKNRFECFPFEIVAKSKKVDLSSNNHIQCDCLHNLKEKLRERNVKNDVIARDLPCAFD